MKFSKLLMAFVVTGLLSACATAPSAPPLTLDALVESAQKGASPESLLATLRTSRVVFGLVGSDFPKLKERGLPDAVLDELLRREVLAARDEQWVRVPPPMWLYRRWPTSALDGDWYVRRPF